MKIDVLKTLAIVATTGLLLTACDADPNSGIFFSKSKVENVSPYKSNSVGIDTVHGGTLIDTLKKDTVNMN
ncbi:hypothetical protein I5M32_15855 [Pedobacter sp. SD-b]|uniref:Lipoprotein n=1 Tax=Pedobacter segetis TaxID=2793069 RepID=A0ABS1BNH2_9SPHI|nr:hypothetical protein [Pedobacter segetis]MBK0384440.1 hypothetical protein [Pedobacter segetis]